MCFSPSGDKRLKTKLLIVEDDEDIRTQLKWALGDGFELSFGEDRASGLRVFSEQRPPVVLLDLGLPPHPDRPDEGLAALAEILARDNLAKVIIISGQSEREFALQAIAQGAYDFLAKPVRTEEVTILLKRAMHIATLERDYRAMQSRLEGEGFEGMLGTSRQVEEIFGAIRKVATTDAPVLLLGESGTGKEMVARAIHRRSERRDGPFVAINCGAIPEALLESELFGHEKGAFTGAHAQRVGRIETASGGTLFLDEIGELPVLLQVKLLRFLQEQRIERVGGRKEIQIDTRTIAATNLDLKKAMAEARFREDLFYRLAVVVIKLPALRDRPNDIPVLARAFLHRSASQNRREGLRFTKEAAAVLQQHQWPGNVRELENRVKRAVIMAEGSSITPADLELGHLPSAGSSRTLKEAREQAERDLVELVLQRNNGQISSTALELGISRPTLYELMQKLGIKRE